MDRYALLLIFFVSAFLRKLYDIPFNSDMLLGIVGMCIVMYAYYWAMVYMSEMVEEKSQRFDMLSGFRPFYEVVPIIISISFAHAHEYGFFKKLLIKNSDYAVDYLKIFVSKIFIIQVVIFLSLFFADILDEEKKWYQLFH